MNGTDNRFWPWVLLVLGALPALALWTYPGWPIVAVGYVPYFNLHHWLASPTLLWIPPYSVRPLFRPHVPIPYMLAALYVSMGGSLLGGLRFAAALALLAGVAGVFVWTLRRWGEWPALVAGLLWLYSPATMTLAFRLGHLGELWFWAIVVWGMAGVGWWKAHARPSIPAKVVTAGSLVLAALVWAPLFWPGLDVWVAYPWRDYVLLWGAVTLLATPAVAWGGRALQRFASPWLVSLMLAALAARLTLVAVAPAYTQYVPPPAPRAVFGDHAIVLLDARVDQPPAPGRTIYVTTAWQALQPQMTDWTTFTQVLGPDNRIWGQHDKPTGDAYPTSRWRVGEVVWDTYVITVAADAPPDLRLIIGLYDRTTLKRLHTRVGADHVDIGQR